MRTIPFKRRIITPSIPVTPVATPKKEGFTMANFAALAKDFPAELDAIKTLYVAAKKLVDDAKAGNVAIVFTDIEALIAPLESAVAAGEQLDKDFTT